MFPEACTASKIMTYQYYETNKQTMFYLNSWFNSVSFCIIPLIFFVIIGPLKSKYPYCTENFSVA